MKTLDEVIKAMAWCTDLDQSGCNVCPYADSEHIQCYKEDALHYLQEYQKETKVLADSKEHYEYWGNRYYSEIEKAEENNTQRKTGKWLWKLADNGWADHICSVCGWTKNTDIHVSLGYNYCPNCGSYMRRKNETIH